MNTRQDPRELAHYLARRVRDYHSCRYQIGAVLEDRAGKIFSWGWSHKDNLRPSIHAEHHALLRANKVRVRGAVMYIAGLRRYTERIILARPCLHCLARIVAFDVSKVVYSIPLGWESINL